MTTISFDTLAYAKKLIAAGFTERQAEVQAETLKEIIDDRLATKQNFKMNEINELNLFIRVALMIAASIAITVSLIKLL